MVKKTMREDHFPAIEKKHGEPMKFWFSVMREISSLKYPEQINYLRSNYGFSQAHANAIVMFSRGSVSPQRFSTLSQYYKSISPIQSRTIKAIMKLLQTNFPSLELVLAWNKPMLRKGEKYIFGISATKNYLLIAPWSTEVIDSMRPKLSAYKVNKKTIQIPSDWQPDSKLLTEMVKKSLAQ